MILTTKARYGVMAIIDIAENMNNDAQKPISLLKISKNQNISLSYLEQIFSNLKNSGIVNSIKGPGGGYILTKKKNEITIADIIKAIGEPIKMTNCTKLEKNCTNPNKKSKCKTHHLWMGLENNIYEYLNSISLDKICK
jgi:Rrf2 family transcriptional regulator, iron-sulfur cluster assembly transcription factor